VANLAIRRFGSELLDDPAASAVVVEESLRNIARSNRLFGGLSAIRYGLTRLLHGMPPGSTVTLLDLGTGYGDGPRAAVAWAARRGIRLIPVGLERSRVAARLATQQQVPTVVGCAGMLPVRDRSVDIVSVAMVAHHFEPDSVVELLRNCDRVARTGVVVSDLRRAPLGRVAFSVGARLLRFDPVTVADGVTSIRRGFTRRELAELLARAGVRGDVVRRPGCRLVATWRTGPE
jgi:SAM-dependent methyltransferase